MATEGTIRSLVWQRETQTRPWNSKFQWIASGSYSVSAGQPWEKHQQRYNPDLLAKGEVDTRIANDFMERVEELVSDSRIEGTDRIYVSIGTVAGKGLDTFEKARFAWNHGNGRYILNTKLRRIKDLKSLKIDLQEKLDDLAEAASRPSWLVRMHVTIYFRDDKEAMRVYQRGTPKHAYRSRANLD